MAKTRSKLVFAALRRCGVKEEFLATWEAEERKRDFLHRLFTRLEKSGDAGVRLVNRMADALIQQTSFPDLDGWEDSKIKREEAQAAVAALKQYRDKQVSQVATAKEQADAKKRAAEVSAEIRARATDLEKLEQAFELISQRIGTQKAGYEFQTWFYKLIDYSEIVNRKPYVSHGRQIDGSITVEGTTYLIELKFTKDQAGSTDIDSFLDKIRTKADNTMGIMVSISGYSSVAKQEASGPGSLILLMDYHHVFLLLRGACSLDGLVSRLRRHSSQTGEAYLAIADFKE